MRRKIFPACAGLAFLFIGLFIWRLDIPNWKNLDIEKLTDVPVSTLVYDADGKLFGTLHGSQNRTFVSLSSIPEHVQNAFIAAEDLRFYSHRGVDVHRMFGALLQNIKSMGYAQGASTITQQLVKLTHLTSEKSMSRKVQEIFLALRLERRMTKSEILESYLNTVYFGRGAYGIAAAAKVYFGKNADELTLAEGALLAGVIKSPSGYAPHLNPEKSENRRNSILNTMADNGYITAQQASEAKAEPVSVIGEPADEIIFGWYLDSVLSEAERILAIPSEDIFSGGYSIYTGFDSALQQTADELFGDAEHFPSNASDGTPVQASMTVMDVSTGAVRAVAGGRKYEVRRGLNRATQIRRQPGSAFKPVSTYAAAIDIYHMVPSSTAEDTPRAFAGGYTPGNAGGASYGTVTLRDALSRSLNIATVDLADLIGIDPVRTYAQRFGLPLSENDTNLSLALGFLTDGVSPFELTGAYCSLANGGMKVNPHFITRIQDASGKIVYTAKAPHLRAVKDSTACMITDMLKTAASEGSAKALSSAGIPVAGKTGTVESGDSGTRDIWTVAYTPQIAVTVWMGFDSPDETHMLPSSEGGSGYPARLCASFLKKAKETLSGEEFQKPLSVKTVLIDELSLELDHLPRLCTESTPSEYVVEELFHAGSLPETFTEYWNAPKPVNDLKLLSDPGETPVLSFTASDANAEYVLYRRTEDSTREIAVLGGEYGTEIRYADAAHDPTQPAEYTIIPRNAYLSKTGILSAGEASAPASYAPGGILNKIMGVGTDNAVQTPAQYEIIKGQSLFG